MEKHASSFRGLCLKLIVWFRHQIRLIRVGMKRGNPMFVGIGCTKLFLVGVAVLALLPQQNDDDWSWRLWSFITAPSNVIGDTLAGVAGVLAFLWIIVTVWLQSIELKEQRKELKGQRDELEEQRKATQDMARSMAAQAKVFEDEQRQRTEERAREKLEEQMLSFLHFVGQHPSVNWKFNRKRADGTGQSGQHSLIPWGLKGKTVDEKVILFTTWLSETSAALQSDWASNNLMSPDDFPEAPLKGYGLKEELEKLIGTKQLLSESQQIRFERLGIETALHFLKEIHGLPVWKEVPVDPQREGQS